MTLKEAIDILEKELECRNRLIEDAEYGIESPCLFECTTCEYNTDSTEARDALSLVLEVVKSKERTEIIEKEACKDLAKDGYNIEDIKKAQYKLYNKYVEGLKPLEEYYEELIKFLRISGALATLPTPIPLPNDIPSHPKCMDCCKDDEEAIINEYKKVKGKED